MEKLCCIVAVTTKPPQPEEVWPSTYHCIHCGMKHCQDCYKLKFFNGTEYDDTPSSRLWYSSRVCGDCKAKGLSLYPKWVPGMRLAQGALPIVEPPDP